jgi:hypothetical protein
MGELPVKAKVILFKPSGKAYTDEEWRIPDGAIGPYDMRQSPDFRRIDGGAVLVPVQEPWGYEFLIMPDASEPTSGPERTEWTGHLDGGPGEGNLITSDTPGFDYQHTELMWIHGVGADPAEMTVRGRYIWHEASGTFRWEPSR